MASMSRDELHEALAKAYEEIDGLREDAARYQFLKAHCGERDLDGGYTLYYVFPTLDRDNGEKKLPIDRRYFNDIDACVDYHRKKA